MEVIFNRLTLAYEVLGKKQPREEYDRYLKLTERTRHAQRRLLEVEQEAVEIERASSAPEPPAEPRPAAVTAPATAARVVSAPPPTGRDAAIPPPPTAGAPSAPPRAPMTEEARAKARELLTRKLNAATGRGFFGHASVPPRGSASAPPAAPIPSVRPTTREGIAKELQRSLQVTAQITGGVHRWERLVEEANRQVSLGDHVAAANALRLAKAIAPDREDVAAEYERVHRLAMAGLAESFESQAKYEEQLRDWTAAAASWTRVAEGCPNLPDPNRRAAEAILRANGDVKSAQRFAERAVELAPDHVPARVALAKVFLLARDSARAREQLAAAARIDPGNEIVKNLAQSLKD